MNDMVSSRNTGGLDSSGTLQSLAGARAPRIQISADKHAVAITEESVTLFNSMPIRGKNPFSARECAHQHQQT